jgi:hypothetical protein
VGIFPKKKVKKKDGVLGDGGRPAGSAADVRSVGEQVRGCAQDVQLSPRRCLYRRHAVRVLILNNTVLSILIYFGWSLFFGFGHLEYFVDMILST